MEFNKAYNRQEFTNFLQHRFLPEDFIPTVEEVPFTTQMNYSTRATKLGTSSSLDIVVYEIKHSSPQDARVSLSKEAFRLLANEMEDRALIVFVPEEDNFNYRFSFIEIKLAEKGTRISHSYSDPHHYSYLLGEGIAYYTPNKYLNEKGRIVDVDDLRSRFSVEVLTKEFYNELSDWYAWAIQIIRFPNDINDKTDDDKYNNESAIRLITRLIFVWFLKQRYLIPDEFFDEKYIAENLIKDFNPHVYVNLFSKSNESKYYKAILQNLFFAMLNSPITPEGKNTISERHFRNGPGDFDNNKLMRYENFFTNPQLFVELANKTVPFLNGGLFDCLDNKDGGMYYDGFSDRALIQKALIVPDFLFFGEEVGKNIDLSEWYGNKKKKKVSARGIIDILKRYNFTVEENTPFDQEVSLDPELLGKVFENLLASFNPETQQTARKQTGSFYTPREIVQYMVDESLVAHLKRTVSEDLELEFRQLIQYTDDEVDLTVGQRIQIMQSLYECKILDPACGSGAFPMGVLQQMVHILNRIDPDNEQWKKMMLDNAINETSEAYRNASPNERKEMISDIECSFDESINRPNYARKLYLIENCIYGVDIQPIAIQISKLRFFISLVVDQKTTQDAVENFGIRPLPNLEAKFVAANTLIGLNKNTNLFDSDVIKQKETELKIAKHKIFTAKTVRTKRKYREKVNELRLCIATMLQEKNAVGDLEARQLATWDMFDQNSSSPFFDSEWMFGIKEGFDILIANPPYVLVQTINNERLVAFYKSNFKVASYKVDLYHLFIEYGLCLLHNNGTLCYINPSNFLTNNYAVKLRKYLLENFCVNKVINIEESVFTANVNTCIIQVHKQKKNLQLNYIKGHLIHSILTTKHLSSVNQLEYIKKPECIIQPVGSHEIRYLQEKINKKARPLKDFATVKFGMQLRNRKKYINDVLSTPTFEQLTKYHRRCLTGKNIAPYISTYENLYCYFNPIAKSGGCWDENIHNTRVKILVRQVGSIPICGIDCSGMAVLNSAFMIICHKLSPFFVLGLINSKLIKFYWEITFEDKRKTFPKIKGTYLKLLPIVKPIDNAIELLAMHINQEKNLCSDVDTSADEQEIDFLVYKLYGLTYDEVKIIDPETLITREEYETMGN